MDRQESNDLLDLTVTMNGGKGPIVDEGNENVGTAQAQRSSRNNRRVVAKDNASSSSLSNSSPAGDGVP
ncbi:hypothetical protein RJT34_20581 [Clitoria ternatea]|uniref:Uncharacterized protein n=1 Tax=Clitoria ternatea TaxID=43366 RepID=A0AAN9P542_CLITE